MNHTSRTMLALGISTIMGTSIAHAQATRTWVSGVGDDVNPCSRTAPCKTFAGAISKTAIGGEISVLDPGGFGAVTIAKSMTIDGNGTLASILATGATGVVINGANVVVTLRNLSINGAGSGVKGISLVDGAALIVDHVSISGFGTGIEISKGSAIVVNSTLTQNLNFAVHALGGVSAVENSTLANNGVGVQAESGATVRISGNAIYNNVVGFGCAGGTLASAGNNRKGNNVGASGCPPTAVVTLQ